VKRGTALMLAALTACSASPAPGLAPADDSAEARAAIAAATVCMQTMESTTNFGYAVAVEQATARRDPSDGAGWIVAFPPGHYMGRLPPPGPGETLLLAVNPAKSSRCTAVPSTPAAR